MAACPPPPGNGLREIRLYGTLGKRFGKVHRLAVQSVAEAVHALSVIVPGFEAWLRAHERAAFKVWSGRANLSVGELSDPVGQREVIRIVPVVTGAKKAGIGNIIIGALLWVAAIAYGVTTGDLATATKIAELGTLFLLGGVIQMLSPQRTAKDDQVENLPSYNFGGAVNVTTEGGPVPLCYGRMIIGSVVISGGISTDDLSPAPPALPDKIGAWVEPQALPSGESYYPSY